ncbi:hypothetical protein CCP3SC1AL1_520026 [Gammaproteobacteria bacterium]
MPFSFNPVVKDLPAFLEDWLSCLHIKALYSSSSHLERDYGELRPSSS